MSKIIKGLEFEKIQDVYFIANNTGGFVPRTDAQPFSYDSLDNDLFYIQENSDDEDASLYFIIEAISGSVIAYSKKHENLENNMNTMGWTQDSLDEHIYNNVRRFESHSPRYKMYQGE